MSAGSNYPHSESETVGDQDPILLERRSAPRFSVWRPIWFRRRGAVPAPGILLNISERGALVRAEKPESAYAVPWPLYLRHGDELWLWDVLEDPLECWVVAVEYDLVRLRIMNDAGILPALRTFLSRVSRHTIQHSEILDPGSFHSTEGHP